MRNLGAALLLSLLALTAKAELVLEITEGVDNPTQLAIVPFTVKGQGLSDLSDILVSDFTRTGLFAMLPQTDMLSFPPKAKDVVYRDWRSLGIEYVVVGNIAAPADQLEIEVEYSLVDVYRQKVVAVRTIKGTKARFRALAHTISDDIYQLLTGVRGAFSTKIMFVASIPVGVGQFDYRLMIADSDGHNERLLLRSPEPIMSPTWAPDGKSVAYVSFESGKSAIYIHNLASSDRKKIIDFPGINGAPTWSPDGSKLAMVLSKDGSPDIYAFDLNSGRLTKLAPHFAIETEPTWTVDGKAILFTSDRGGRPQIYKVSMEDGWVERLTFEGNYNARAEVLPDGSGFVFIHRRAGRFHVAVKRFDSDHLTMLTSTKMDESPSVAANGAMLMYATSIKGKGILAAVAIDGGAKYRLPSDSSDVREPAWSPFIH